MTEPLVVEIMRQFRADLLSRDAQQMRQMAREWRMVERALEPRIELLAQRAIQMQADGLVVTRGMIAQDARYRELLGQMQAEINKFTRRWGVKIGEEQETYLRLGLESAREALSVAVVEGAFNILPISAVENMVGLAGDGSPLLALLQEAYPTAAQGMMNALIRSTALGINPRVTARAMADGMASALNRCMTIARTEQLRVYREANRQQMIESGVVTGYKRVATKDLRTCAGCLFADGMEFSLLSEFAEHPNGRCVAVPIIRGESALEWQYGTEWFSRQDEKGQRQILGPARFEMWKNGDVSLADMVSIRGNKTWGPTIGVKPIAKLGG